MLKYFFLLIFLSFFIISCGEDTVEQKELCKAVTCSSHGSCEVVNNKATCNCNDGYTADGLECKKDIEIIKCETDSCTESHKTKCSVENNQILCSCDDDYHDVSGACEINTVNCETDSCTELHKTKCSVENNQILCSCDDNYHDVSGACEINTVNCEADSCTEAHKTKCSVEDNQILCSCDDDYHEDGDKCVKNTEPECLPECRNWEECDTRPMTPVCRVKEERCNNNDDCTDMICDTDSHYCYPVKNSWSVMPSANGFGAILFDKNEKKIKTYYPHIYKQTDENSAVTPNLAYDFYFGIRINGENKWLNEVDVTNMEYIPGTGIIKVTKEFTDLEVTEYYWTSMLSEAPVVVAGITIKNKTANPLNNVSIFTLGNFRVGADDNEHKQNEKADYNDTLHGFYERAWGVMGYEYYQVFLMSGEGEPSVISTNNGDYNPWLEVKNNNILSEYKSSGDTQKNDVSLFYQKDFTTINSNEEKSYFVAWNSKFSNEGYADEVIATPIKNLIENKTFEEVLNDEINYWTNWHSIETLAENLTAREQRLAIQSSAFIKMGQIREDIDGYGQILASLPPGIWNVSWIRDMSYAVVGMIKANHIDESLDALEFIFSNKANAGRYGGEEWNRIGHDYQISVCRYFANGDEETDYNSAGPNIEYDGFGLALWILDEYTMANNDNTDFLIEYRDNIFTKTADVLVALIDNNGLIAPDSSIWEYHWTDDGYNGKRHFSYTSITAYRGLKAAERLGNLIGMDTTIYHDTAQSLKDAIETHLVKNSVLTNFVDGDVSPSAPENGQNIYNIDASSVEAFNFGVFDPNSQIASSTLTAYEQELGNLISKSPGFKRTNKRCDPNTHASCVGTIGGVTANEYDIKEWIMVDFRILNFLRKRTDDASKEKANKLYNWILTQTEHNYYQIAELYDEQRGNYAGSVPMCGFGPGAYLIDLSER